MPKNKSKAKAKLIVEAEAELVDAVKDRAEFEDRSMAAMIRHALRQYLTDNGVTLPGSDGRR